MTDWSPEARRTRIAVREALMILAARPMSIEGAWLDKHYPAPPPLTPRVVVDPLDAACRWCVVDGRLQVDTASSEGWCSPNSEWFTAPQYGLSERWKLWADLYANPTRTEPVDDE